MSIYNYDIIVPTVTPTVTAANAYGTNFVVGGLLTFPNVYTVSNKILVQAVGVTCKRVETSGFTFVLFSGNPSNTTWTDAAAANINVADTSLVRSINSLTASSVLGTHTIATATNLVLPVSNTSTGNSLFGVLLTNAVLTNNFTSTTDITVFLQIFQLPF